MPRIEEVAIFRGVAGANFAAIATKTGEWGLVVKERVGVEIIGPDGQQRSFAAPQIHRGALAVADGMLVVNYTAFLGQVPGTSQDNPDRPWRRLHTDIACGAAAAATETVAIGPRGGPGPKGDKGDPGTTTTVTRVEHDTVDDQDIDRIAQATAERVFALPPADWAQSIQPPEARSGTRFQDMLTVHMINPAFWVGVLQAMGKAARDLITNGWKP